MNGRIFRLERPKIVFTQPGSGAAVPMTMHPHITGHRSRMAVLERLIEYIQGHEDVWFATHAEIAQYCLDNA